MQMLRSQQRALCGSRIRSIRSAGGNCLAWASGTTARSFVFRSAVITTMRLSPSLQRRSARISSEACPRLHRRQLGGEHKLVAICRDGWHDSALLFGAIQTEYRLHPT